jgi:hypothetical protein
VDNETRHELSRLFQAFESALEEVRFAANEDRELLGWRKVQMAGWELNELLPAARRQRSAS